MLKIDFPDRDYELGGLIDVSIILAPDRDITIRSARVDLMCNQTYIRHSEWEGGPASLGGHSGRISGGGVFVRAGIDSEQRTESYVHSTVTTLEDASFRADVTETRRVDLRIAPTTPKRLRDAVEEDRNAAAGWSFAWVLTVSLDIARGRDIEVEREVKVKLPPLPARTSNARPSMSRPKRPTGTTSENPRTSRPKRPTGPRRPTGQD